MQIQLQRFRCGSRRRVELRPLLETPDELRERLRLEFPVIAVPRSVLPCALHAVAKELFQLLGVIDLACTLHGEPEDVALQRISAPGSAKTKSLA